MAEHRASHSAESNGTTRAGRFPYVAVIASAVALIAVGGILMKLGAGGSLPTGLGLGEELPASEVGGVDLDLTRGTIVVAILSAIAALSLVVLRKRKK